jgi:cytochrome c oxidase subunit I+III
VSPDVWPSRGTPALPGLDRPLLSAALCVIAVVGFAAAGRWLPSAGTRAILPATLGVLVGCAALSAAVAVEIVAHWQNGLRPEATAYGAMVYLAGLLAAQVVAAVVFMGLFTVARLVAGRTDRERRNSFDHTALLAYYAAAQTLLGLGLVHGFPRLLT